MRSSIARRLGVDIGALAPADRNVDGVVDMVLDATQQYEQALTPERLFGWHAALLPTGYSGRVRIQGGRVAQRRCRPHASGVRRHRREKVHYEAPPATALPAETKAFLQWFNAAPNRAEGTAQRFYSLSAQIQRERQQYYDQL